MTKQFECGNLCIDIATLTASRNGTSANLTPAEFIVVFAVADNKGSITREQANDLLALPKKSRMLDQVVKRLREKIGWEIEAVRNEGYKLRENA